jgi:hypothetical protein
VQSFVHPFDKDVKERDEAEKGKKTGNEPVANTCYGHYPFKKSLVG